MYILTNPLALPVANLEPSKPTTHLISQSSLAKAFTSPFSKSDKANNWSSETDAINYVVTNEISVTDC